MARESCRRVDFGAGLRTHLTCRSGDYLDRRSQPVQGEVVAGRRAASGFPVRLVGGFFPYAHRAGNGQSECGIFRPTWLGSVSPIRRTDADRYGIHGALPIQAKRDHDAAVGECLHERPARLPVKMESA